MEITVIDKHFKPGVIHTNQFENGVYTLTFKISDYMQGEVDLRKFNAYAVTSINGQIDITQLDYTVSGREMTLTWNLTAYTLRTYGVMRYKLRFSESAEDGTAVWYTCDGIITNRETIPVDDYMAANYPTIMKQWLDRINQLSGSYESEIIYMLPDASIDVTERLAGRLYYQIENHTSWEGHFEDHNANRLGEFNAKYIANPDINTMLTHGEYVVAGTMTNAPMSCTFAFLHVTDSGSTNQQLQTFYGVMNNKITTYVRTVYNGGTGFGAWNQLVTDEQLALKQDKNVGTANMVLVTDADGNIAAHSTVSTSELGALNGFTVGAGSVQTQINNINTTMKSYGWLPNYNGGVSISTGATVPCAAIGIAVSNNTSGTIAAVNVGDVTVFKHNCSDTGYSSSVGCFFIPKGSKVNFDCCTVKYYPLTWQAITA